MTLKIGNSDIKLYLGESEVSAVYLGNVKVYELSTPVVEIIDIDMEDQAAYTYNNTLEFVNGYPDTITDILEVSTLSNGVIYSGKEELDPSYEDWCEYTYDGTPTGEVSIIKSIPINKLNNMTVNSGVYNVSNIKNSGLFGGTIVVKKDNVKLSDNLTNGSTLIIQGNNIDFSSLKIEDGIVYIITNNSSGDITLDGGNLYITGSNNNITLTQNDGNLYINGGLSSINDIIGEDNYNAFGGNVYEWTAGGGN